jgi:hypothetical protein
MADITHGMVYDKYTIGTYGEVWAMADITGYNSYITHI